MKFKKWLTLPFIMISMLFITPISASAETYYSEYYYDTEIYGHSFDDIALVSVYKREESAYIDLIVTITNTYTPQQIANATGRSVEDAYSALLGLWYSNENGVTYNGNECEIVFWCADRDSKGNRKFELQIDDNWAPNTSRAYWTTSISELQVGDKICCLVKLLDGVSQANVTIFGKPFTITAPVETIMTAPELPVEVVTPDPISVPEVSTTPESETVTTTTTTVFVKRPAPVITGTMDYVQLSATAANENEHSTEESTTTTVTTISTSTDTTNTTTTAIENLKKQVMNTVVTAATEPEIEEPETKHNPTIILIAIVCVLSFGAGVIIHRIF